MNKQQGSNSGYFAQGLKGTHPYLKLIKMIVWYKKEVKLSGFVWKLEFRKLQCLFGCVLSVSYVTLGFFTFQEYNLMISL